MATAAVTNSFAAGTLIESVEVNTNFSDLVSFLNNQVIHKDATVAFTAVPSGPAVNPVSANQLPRKAYVDVPRYHGSVVVAAAASSGAQGNYSTLAGWATATSNRITGTANGCTITETGYYWVEASTEIFAITGTHFGVALYVNGARRISHDLPASSAVNLTTPTYIVSRVLSLTAGDTVACRYAQNTGGNAAVNGFLSVIGLQGTF